MAMPSASCARCGGLVALSAENFSLGWTCPFCGHAHGPPGQVATPSAAPWAITAGGSPARRPVAISTIAVVVALIGLVGVAAYGATRLLDKAPAPAAWSPADVSPTVTGPLPDVVIQGARNRAADRAAQSDLRNAFTAEKTIYTDAIAWATPTSDYDQSGDPDLNEVEPFLQYRDGSVPLEVGVVYIEVQEKVLFLSIRSETGSCFYLKDDATTATVYGWDDDGTCGAASTVTYSQAHWD